MEILGDIHFFDQKKLMREWKGLQYAVGVPEVCEREPWQQKTVGGGAWILSTKYTESMASMGSSGKPPSAIFPCNFVLAFERWNTWIEWMQLLFTMTSLTFNQGRSSESRKSNTLALYEKCAAKNGFGSPTNL